MSEARNLHLDEWEQRVLDVMRRQPDEIYTTELLTDQLGRSATEIRAALAKLERLGFVSRNVVPDGRDEYAVNPAGPTG